MADNAPVTTAGVLTTAVAGQGTTPIRVSKFMDISSFKLTFRYRSAVVTNVTCAVDGAFSGATVTTTFISGSVNQMVIAWTGGAGITLPDQSHLADLSFTYVSGSTILEWDTSSSATCYYKGYNNGSPVLLNDLWKRNYYINGGISNRGAPVIYAPVIANAVPGNINIPVIVRNFTNIGAFSLQIKYDSTVLSYKSYTANAAFAGGILLDTTNKKQYLVINWCCSGISLTDGSTLINFVFTYSNATKNYSSLTWNTDGTPYEFSDGSGLILIDKPSGAYYKNGLVFANNYLAPQVSLPVITNATPSGSVNVPVNANNFKNVNSFILSFNYDPAIVTYSSFTPNPLLGGTMNVTNNPPSGGVSKLSVSWSGTAKSLQDGSALVTVSFSNVRGASALTFVTDAASCHFNDAAGHAYYDLPKAGCYKDGLVTTHAAPHTIGWYAFPSPAQSITVPVKITGFTNIGSVALTVDYDPGVLTYQAPSLAAFIGGTFNYSLTEAGRQTLSWSGPAASLDDSAALFNLNYTYNGG